MSSPLIKGVLAGVLLVLCNAHVLAQTELIIGGGSRSGVYYQAALELCGAVNRAAKDKLRCLGRPSLGSVFNIKAVERGLLDFGIAQSDRIWQAVQGRADWSKAGPATTLRTVFSLHSETILLVVRKDSGIRFVNQLKGRRVNLGNPGSGQRGNAEDVLRIYGVDPKRDLRAEGLQQSDASRALTDGKIDAFFYTVGNPSTAISSAAEAIGIDLLPLDSPGIQAFVEARPYYVMTSVPAGTYHNIHKPTRTFAVKATLVTSAKTSDDTVYEVVKSVFSYLEDIKGAHSAFAQLHPAGMLQGLSAPLHPGAARYFRELGLAVGAN